MKFWSRQRLISIKHFLDRPDNLLSIVYLLCCFQVYLKIADQALCSELYQRAIDKLKEEDKEDFVKTAVLDLIRALIRYLTFQQISQMYRIIFENVTDEKCQHRQQKKYFRYRISLCLNLLPYPPV